MQRCDTCGYYHWGDVTPPLDICWYFTEQLRCMGQILQEVWVDADGSLAHSTNFAKFFFRLDVPINDTGGYPSYLNGKAERSNRMIASSVRAMICNHNKEDKQPLVPGHPTLSRCIQLDSTHCYPQNTVLCMDRKGGIDQQPSSVGFWSLPSWSSTEARWQSQRQQVHGIWWQLMHCSIPGPWDSEGQGDH